jgi:hypothetical protein
MTHRTPSRARLIAATSALFAALLAATALASVSVYDNDFSSRSEVKELKKSGGKQCARKFVQKGAKRTMRVTVKAGPATCSLRPPVQADGALPDHELRVDAKIAKSTAKSARKGAFLGASLRVGGNGIGYLLRVFPETGRFKLTRVPGGGGGDFPADGTSEAIAGVGKKNTLRLSAEGATVRAVINGTEVAQVTDSDPGAVSGRKLRFAVGNDKQTGKAVVATVKKVTVAVPDP